MGDNTGTAGQRIVIDAVRFSESTGIEQFSNDVSLQFTVSASPAASFSVSSPHGGHLRIIDVCGRVVTENSLQPGDSWTWNESAPSGVYFISIDGIRGSSSCSVVLLK